MKRSIINIIVTLGLFQGCLFYSFRGSLPVHIHNISLAPVINESAEFAVAEILNEELNELMVEENLKMGLYARNSSNEVLDWALSLFPVLKTRLKQKSGTLSGGEQQMLATARALCLEPRYILMDEPSEGLMPRLIETIFDIVEKLKSEKVGVLLVEQKIEGTLRISDRIVFLENGILKEETTPEQLIDNPEPLEKYVGVKSHTKGRSPSFA